MTMNPHFNETTRDRLQDLRSINIDSCKGWQHAAENVNDVTLRSFFEEMSQVREHNAQELSHLIGQSGEQPTDSGSISGQLHRWWIDAKQALTGGDAEAVLREAERGEDSIKHEYEEVLADISDPQARTVVERQFENVQRGHDQVKALRERYKNPRG